MVEDAIEALADGRLVIVVDGEDREDEGDFVAAAQTVTAELIHFMTSHGRGQLCVPVVPETAARLELAPMVLHADPSLPRFAIPIDHRACKSGISPAERATTIRAMVDAATTASDFVRPGHIFPLIAEAKGLLERIGHTEAAIDLARMAGLIPMGVLCEICSRDGRTMAGRKELRDISQRFNLPMVTIDQLVEFRQGRDSTSAAGFSKGSSSIDHRMSIPR